MAIIIENNRVHLTDATTFSRVLGLVEVQNRIDVEELYFGKAIPQTAVPLLKTTRELGIREEAVRDSAAWLYPAFGSMDHRINAIKAVESNGTCACELSFSSWRIISGKPHLEGLPQVYCESNSEAETLEIILKDEISGLQAVIHQSVLHEYHTLCVSASLKNNGSETMWLERMQSCTLHLQGSWDMLHLHGQWAAERQIERIPSAHAVRSIGSTRGASGHYHNPFIAMMEPSADEKQGNVIGISLCYSGSFLMDVEQDERGLTRITAGLAPCRWKLACGSELQLPEVVVVYSEHGINGMSQIYHKLYRERLCRGMWRDRPRPVLCNNWEATYFNFSEDSLLRIARTAADLGAELFVLDDGWFGERNDDTSSLGDWYLNCQKLPNGLRYLSDKIHAMGLKFGLWIEPEMLNPVSHLYNKHPDWCLHAPGRYRTEQRNQLILDLTRQDVRDWLCKTIIDVLSDANVDYVKWDMNRNFAEVGSDCLPPDQQGEIAHRYILGVYEVMERITSAMPHVLFEGCASGGGRYDPGLLYYMPQFWTSDDTDAVERLKIQYGTSVVYPVSTMGAHVSAVPNHQVGRMCSMRFRGDVALSGNMGYELDLSKLSDEDKEEVRRQIAFVKQVRTLTQQGCFTRLQSPIDHRIAAWQFANSDDSELLICVFQRYAEAVPAEEYISITDIDDQAIYQDDSGNKYSGALLKYKGLRVSFATQFIPGDAGDQKSMILHLHKLS